MSAAITFDAIMSAHNPSAIVTLNLYDNTRQPHEYEEEVLEQDRALFADIVEKLLALPETSSSISQLIEEDARLENLLDFTMMRNDLYGKFAGETLRCVFTSQSWRALFSDRLVDFLFRNLHCAAGDVLESSVVALSCAFYRSEALRTRMNTNVSSDINDYLNGGSNSNPEGIRRILDFVCYPSIINACVPHVPFNVFENSILHLHLQPHAFFHAALLKYTMQYVRWNVDRYDGVLFFLIEAVSQLRTRSEELTIFEGDAVNGVRKLIKMKMHEGPSPEIFSAMENNHWRASHYADLWDDREFARRFVPQMSQPHLQHLQEVLLLEQERQFGDGPLSQKCVSAKRNVTDFCFQNKA